MDKEMGKAEYEMYRAIPAEEIGIESPAHHMSFDEWKKLRDLYINSEFDKEKPYIVFIMYLEKYPIGWISLSLYDLIDDEDDNVSYCVRPVCRGKGLSAVMLNLLKDEAKKRGIGKLVGFANKHNVASWKAMEESGFSFVRETAWASKQYELKLGIDGGKK
jgi:RimJ/RimL family protein N-acetyltransferase